MHMHVEKSQLSLLQPSLTTDDGHNTEHSPFPRPSTTALLTERQPWREKPTSGQGQERSPHNRHTKAAPVHESRQHRPILQQAGRQGDNSASWGPYEGRRRMYASVGNNAGSCEILTCSAVERQDAGWPASQPTCLVACFRLFGWREACGWVDGNTTRFVAAKYINRGAGP